MNVNKALLAIVTCIVFGFVGACALDSDQDYSSTKQKTSSFIEKGMEKHGIAGLSIALVDGAKTVWSQGFGYADKNNKITAKEDTVYMLGSVSKTLTAAAVLNLYDRGKIVDLNDPLYTYLEEFEMQPRYTNQLNEMTIKRLLNHHSGIPGDILNGAFVTENWNEWDNNLYSNWVLDYLKHDYPSHRPGQVASYSNTAFTLLGEMVTDLGWADTFNQAMHQILLDPLNMEDTSFRIIEENLAKGYVGGKEILPPYEVNMGASGGAFTTAADMAEFIKMILGQGWHPNGERILEPETVALMGEKEDTPLDIDGYFQPGLGLDSVNDPAMRYAGRAWAKDGGTKNFQTFLEILPDRDLGVIVLSNSYAAAGFKYQVGRECLRNAVKDKYGQEPEMPEMPDYESLSNPQTIEGIYVHAGGYDKVIDNGADTLTWIRDAQSNSSESLQLIYDYKNQMYDIEGKDYHLAFLDRQWKDNIYVLMTQYGAPADAPNYISYGHLIRALGQNTAKTSIPEAWQSKQGKRYIIENIAWNDIFMWNYAYFTLNQKDGLLMLNGHNDQIIFPENDNLAFVRGLQGQRADSAIRFIEEDNKEKLVYGGFKAYDINLVPSIEVGDTVSESCEFFQNKWYKLTIENAGQMLNIAVDNENYTLRILGQELKSVAAKDKGSLQWNAEPGTWYLAVAPNPDAANAFELSISK